MAPTPQAHGAGQVARAPPIFATSSFSYRPSSQPTSSSSAFHLHHVPVVVAAPILVRSTPRPPSQASSTSLVPAALKGPPSGRPVGAAPGHDRSPRLGLAPVSPLLLPANRVARCGQFKPVTEHWARVGLLSQPERLFRPRSTRMGSRCPTLGASQRGGGGLQRAQDLAGGQRPGSWRWSCRCDRAGHRRLEFEAVRTASRQPGRPGGWRRWERWPDRALDADVGGVRPVASIGARACQPSTPSCTSCSSSPAARTASAPISASLGPASNALTAVLSELGSGRRGGSTRHHAVVVAALASAGLPGVVRACCRRCLNWPPRPLWRGPWPLADAPAAGAASARASPLLAMILRATRTPVDVKPECRASCGAISCHRRRRKTQGAPSSVRQRPASIVAEHQRAPARSTLFALVSRRRVSVRRPPPGASAPWRDQRGALGVVVRPRQRGTACRRPRPRSMGRRTTAAAKPGVN